MRHVDGHGKLPSLASEIRAFVCQHYVGPARMKGLEEVEIRTGDVHHDMRLTSRMPTVCTALGTKFENECGVHLIERRGPQQGSNVFFRFQINLKNAKQDARLTIPIVDLEIEKPVHFDYENERIFLVSCVAKKRPYEIAAKDLYISPWFMKARRYIEHTKLPWFILSAKYGLLRPEKIIQPYEQTLNAMLVDDRRQWADRVTSQLFKLMPAPKSITFFAGAHYRDFLTEPLQAKGISIEIPMKGLGIGQQLRWLGQN